MVCGTRTPTKPANKPASNQQQQQQQQRCGRAARPPAASGRQHSRHGDHCVALPLARVGKEAAGGRPDLCRGGPGPAGGGGFRQQICGCLVEGAWHRHSSGGWQPWCGCCVWGVDACRLMPGKHLLRRPTTGPLPPSRKQTLDCGRQRWRGPWGAAACSGQLRCAHPLARSGPRPRRPWCRCHARCGLLGCSCSWCSSRVCTPGVCHSAAEANHFLQRAEGRREAKSGALLPLLSSRRHLVGPSPWCRSPCASASAIDPNAHLDQPWTSKASSRDAS